MLRVAKINERIQAFNRFKNDVAAFAAIAAIGAAIFDKFFAPERHSTRAASARANENLGLIKEMHSPPLGEMAQMGSVAAAQPPQPMIK